MTPQIEIVDAQADSVAFRPQRVTVDRVMRFCCPTIADLEDSPFPEEISRQNINLPLFGDCSRYGVSSKVQKRLWALEITRLLELVAEKSSAKLIPQLRSNTQSFVRSSITSSSLERLQLMAEAVLGSLHACNMDDQTLLSESSVGMSAAAISTGEKSYFALEQLFGQKPNLPGHFEQTNVDHSVAGGVTIGAKGPRFPSRLQGTDIEAYHHLLDQIAATVAIVAISGSESDYWHVIVIACLAKLSTKLKVIAADLSKNLRKCKDVNYRLIYSKDRPMQNDSEEENHIAPLNDDSPPEHRYCREVASVVTWLFDCFSTSLVDLGAKKPWQARGNVIDLCVLIYPTGLEGRAALVSQNRRGEIGGSTGLISLASSSICINLVRDIATCFRSQQTSAQFPQTISAAGNGERATMLTCRLEKLCGKSPRNEKHEVLIRNIMDLVVAICPLSLSKRGIGEGFESSLRTISSLSAFGKANLKQTGSAFYTYVCLSSGSLESAQEEFSPLSSSYLARVQFGLSDRNSSPPELHNFQQAEHHTDTDLFVSVRKRRLRMQMTCNRWKTQETSIVINCAPYVYTIWAVSGTIVLIGLASGFFVGERISGVDPFNLAVFSWLIGGFIILIAKSIRVSDWAWRDFLLRQVTCRSLSEVSSVTGLEPQDILLYLLSTESNSILQTGGPYQRPFSKPGSSGGFIIDVKADLQTLLASGILPVGITTLEGPALVFLRLLPSSPGIKRVAIHGGLRRGEICFNLPSSIDGGDVIMEAPKDSSEPVKRVRNVNWNGVLGLYNNQRAQFR